MITNSMIRPCSRSIRFPPVSLLSLTHCDRVTVKLRYFSSPNLFSAPAFLFYLLQRYMPAQGKFNISF